MGYQDVCEKDHMASVPKKAPNGECLNVHPGMLVHEESISRLWRVGLPQSSEKEVKHNYTHQQRHN